ncbi:MAG: LLM class flavin-dependent oxidoreductase [Pseudomonadota bacterium]
MRLGALLGPRYPGSPNAIGAGQSSAGESVVSGPGLLGAQARWLESLGYDSLWCTQAFGRGYGVMDPFVALSVAAASTSRIELGTAILQLPLYPSADVAYRAWSLQRVSGGRLSLGLGAGSVAAEFEAFGRDHANRFAAFEASVTQLRDHLRLGAIGTCELVDRSPTEPPPPLLLGTWGHRVESAARDFGGWIASGRYRGEAALQRSLERYRGAGGRRAIVSTVLAGSDRRVLAARLGRLAAMGFDDAVVLFDSDDSGEVVDPAAVRELVT